MRFVGNYALCGLSPQTDGMPVILKKSRLKCLLFFCRCLLLDELEECFRCNVYVIAIRIESEVCIYLTDKCSVLL